MMCIKEISFNKETGAIEEPPEGGTVNYPLQE